MKKKQLAFEGLNEEATPIISGSPVRVELKPFVPRPAVRQESFFAALGLPPVVIPKPKPKKVKPVPKEQMSLF